MDRMKRCVRGTCELAGRGPTNNTATSLKAACYAKGLDWRIDAADEGHIASSE